MSNEDNKILKLKYIKQGYRELKISQSLNLDQFIKYFFESKTSFKNQKFFSMFNEHVFTSDMQLTEDDIFLTVTGMTKKQYQINKQQFVEQYVKKYEDHKNHLDLLMLEWVNKGHEILNKRFWDTWDKIVTYRAGSVYLGDELNNVLDLIKLIKSGNDYDVVLNELIKLNPNKEKYLIIKKMLWLLGCEGFVQHLNANIIVNFDDESDKNESN